MDYYLSDIEYLWVLIGGRGTQLSQFCILIVGMKLWNVPIENTIVSSKIFSLMSHTKVWESAMAELRNENRKFTEK